MADENPLSMAEIFEQAQAAGVEELHPDLAAHLCEIPGLGPAIRHPLVYSVPHGDSLNGIMNRVLEQKQRMVAQAERAGDIAKVVMLHEPPWRLHAMRAYEGLIETDRSYWDLLRGIWIATDNPHQNEDLWREMWLSDREDRDSVMTPQERAALRRQEDVFTIWRGGHHPYTLGNGFSWTLERDKAIWFANRFPDPPRRVPHLCEARVRREDVLALFLTGEKEIVVDPDTLVDRTILELPVRGRFRA